MSTGTQPQWEFDPHALRVKVDVTLSADLGRISGVVEPIMEMMKEMQCACGKEFEVETALREALANAIIHGARGDAGKQVQCSVACDEDRGMLIVVRDPGEGFDPSQLESPLFGDNLYSEHGRGIFLINQLMERVSIHAGGTEIRMQVKGGKPCAGEMF